MGYLTLLRFLLLFMIQGYNLTLRVALVVWLSMLATGVALAQKQGQARIDSLKAELPRAKADSNRVKLLYRIGFESASTNPSEALQYAEQTLQLAQQIRWPLGLVRGYNLLGISYYLQSDLPKSLEFYLTGLKLAESIRSQYYIGSLANNIGNIYSQLENYPQSIEYYKKSLEIDQQFDPSGQGIAPSLANLGTIYKRLKDYPHAITYLQKALTLSQQRKQYDVLGTSLVSLGSVYLAQQDFGTALRYLRQGLQVQKQQGDRSRVASAYDDMAQLFLRVARQPSQLPLLNLPTPQAALLQAKAYADTACAIAQDLKRLLLINENELTLSQIEEALGHPQAALASYQRHIAAKEEAIKQADQSKITAMALRYDFDKKETALRYEQQLTNARLQQQTLLNSQQAQELSLKTQAAQLASKERDVQRLQYVQEKAQKQERERQLALAEKEKALGESALALSKAEVERQNQQRNFLLIGLTLLALLLGLLVRGYRQLKQQKQEVHRQHDKAEQALADLRATQAQLVQREKMASLGELTAGIAHEIQNPLNFVNNFSEVSLELVNELADERRRLPADRDEQLEGELLGDLSQNLSKIAHHGKRAGAIVGGMLAHSRTGTGQKQPTSLNTLAEEYLRLAYQNQQRRKEGKEPTAQLVDIQLSTRFDESVGQVTLVPQEIGRVLLNLYNNAFYAVEQRSKGNETGFVPQVRVRTERLNGSVRVRVEDNGTGMAESVQAKIFQPFFTTKPTGEGTGLGLSLSYDIITKGHGGTLQVTSALGQGAEFVITLPG